MENKLDSVPFCYTFDASSLIELERRPGGRGLKDMPGYPGSWLVIPSRVAKQINNRRAPKETSDWLARGKVADFVSDHEAREFMRIRVQERLLEDPDIQGIVIAYHRGCTYVVDDGRARTVAESLGVRCINARGFLSEVQPHLL
jgi:predicted nucleic acid-binding protein